MTTPLSPATQAVLDAFLNGYVCRSSCNVAFEADRNGIAAALRAAADQVVPEECMARFPNNSEWQDGFTAANERIRTELLAIVAELEAGND